MAGGFRFRLQVVLDLEKRRQDEQSKQMRLAEDMLASEEKRLAEIAHERQSLHDTMRDMAAGGRMDLDRLLDAQRFQGTLDTRERARTKALEQARERVEMAREALVAVARKVQVLEKLREQSLKEWVALENRREALMLDELATIRHGQVPGLQVGDGMPIPHPEGGLGTHPS
jgi:flagellar export protein FliJ